MVNVVELNLTNWEKEVSQPDLLTAVYFWHEHCPYCAMFNPVFNEVAEEYGGKMKFAKLNILENPDNREIAVNLGVMSTPTLVFYCSSRPIGQVVGLMSKGNLEKTLDDMLGRYGICIKQSTDLKRYIV